MYSDVVLFCFQSRRHKFDSRLVTCKIIKESLTNAAHHRFDGWMDGWIICDFISFSTVFQAYQDDGRMIMKGSVQWNTVCG